MAPNIIEPRFLQMFIKSKYVSNTLKAAAGTQPISEEDALKLRNVLISTFIINNLRPSMEMSTFSLRDYLNHTETKKDGMTYYVMFVAEHKTGSKSKFRSYIY